MDAIAEMVTILKRAFPERTGDHIYFGVLAALYEDMSDENLAKVVAQWMGKNRLDVWNDIPLALSMYAANREIVEEISSRLRGAGWEPDGADDD